MAEQIAVLDENKMLDKINELPNQLEKAWATYWTKDIALKTGKITNILICGMGGSGIAGALAAELFSDNPIRITAHSDYGLPAWISEQTLVVLISYSGETEETLDVAKAVAEKGLSAIAITSGGALEEIAIKNKWPILKVDYKSAPRTAIGWLYGLLLVFLTKTKLVTFSEKLFFDALKELQHNTGKKPFLTKAEELAVGLNNKVPLILTQSPLSSVTKRWVNQLNENSKTFAFSATVPELCHNTIVGLDFAIPEKLSVLYLESSYAFSRNTARRKILEKLFDKKEISFIPLSVKTNTLLAEQLLLIYFGDLVSYYLAGVYGVDPTPVDSIQFLKEELNKI